MTKRVWLRTLLVATAPILCALTGTPEVYAQPAGASQPSPTDVKSATDHFKKGEDFFKAKKFELALQEFKTSYATVPSPNSHLYVARSLTALGEHRDAYVEFEKVIAEVEARKDPKYAPTGETAKLERDELTSKVAFVTVTVKNADPSATLKVGGTVVPPDQFGKPIIVKPGATDISLEIPSKPPVSQSVSIEAGEKKNVSLDAGPPPPVAPPPTTEPAPITETPSTDRSNLRPYAYVAGGVGAVGLIVFTIAGVMANSTYSDLEDKCKGSCPPGQGYEDDIDAGKTQQTLANVGLVFGVLGAATGITLFVLSSGGGDAKKGEAARGKPARADLRASLLVAPNYTGVRGQF